MAGEELTAHGSAELAGQERSRRGMAAREQAVDVVERAEGKGERRQLRQGGGAGPRLWEKEALQVVVEAVGHGGKVAAVARP
eukprot:2588245-Pleurochrysis_carterae.AAC.1